MVSSMQHARHVNQAFRLDLGSPALNLAATLAGRLRARFERLGSPADLDRWLADSGLASERQATPRHLLAARRLREAIYDVVNSTVLGETPPRAAIAELNAWARRTPLAPQLGDGTVRLVGGGDPVQAALATVAQEAVRLVGGSPSRIRKCADATCSLFFIDHSHSARRRWCSMKRCGNRAKVGTYRSRRASSGTNHG